MFCSFGGNLLDIVGNLASHRGSLRKEGSFRQAVQFEADGPNR